MAMRFQSPSGLSLHLLPAGAALFRIHHAATDPSRCSPLAPDITDGRGAAFGVLHAADSLEAAFVSLFLRTRARLIARAYAQQRMWTALSFSRPLRLVQWRDDAASSRVKAPALARREAILSAFHASPHIDGLAYRPDASNTGMTYVVFERALKSGALRELDARRFDVCRDQVDELMRRGGAAWDESPTPGSPPA